jgi:RNA polymerase sigma factor (sigma-70 family)
VAQALDPVLAAPRARIPKRLLSVRGDTYLAAHLQKGDEAAFEVLYDRYSSPLLSFCRHMLGRQDEAEDALQQVFASAHADLLRNRRVVQLKPWLYAIARNRCLDMLRARREHPAAGIEPVAAGLPDRVQERADLRELVADLHDLPENQRAALLLTELDDLSHSEAAGVLDCEPAQVKGLVFRAREGLIERRAARAAPCEDIRAELATARRGGLRRGRLRHHLAECPGCTAYLADVRRQRKMMALILPVIPATGLKRSVLTAAGIGTGTGGAGGMTVAGSSLLSGTVAKVALVGALAGGAGMAREQIVDHREAPPARKAPSAAGPAEHPELANGPAAVRRSPASPPASPREKPRPATTTPAGSLPQKRSNRNPASSRGRRGTQGKSRSNRGASPPGLNKPATGGQRYAPRRPARAPGPVRNAPVTRRQTPARATPTPVPQVAPEAKARNRGKAQD